MTAIQNLVLFATKEFMNKNKTTIVIAEDHPIVRQGIKNLLAYEEEMVIVGEASNGQEAIALAKELHPMVMVIDISMPILNGLNAARQIQKINPNIKIIILSAYYDDSYILQVSKLNFYGYVTKKCTPQVLINAIKNIHTMERYFSPEVLDRYNVLNKMKIDNEGITKTFVLKLTNRERQVLQLIAEGHANKQIASLLDISIKTVEKHRQNIMNKLKIHDTAGLTRYAISEGIIGINANINFSW